MAIAAGTLWEFNASATASMVNGGGFNTNNANFISNFTTDANTANTDSPVLSSASYNFVAGDVGHWIYVKSGTNWTPGFYKIASVASNKATLNAAVGAAVQYSSTRNRWIPNTVSGCATVGTPTNGTCGVDYSQSTSALSNVTDLASSNGTTNPSAVTSATLTFTAQHVGNILHVTAGTNWTAGWYEVVSVSGGAATLDRAVGTAASISSGTAYLGGALSLNSTLDDSFFETIVAGNFVFFKSGSYSTGQAITVASTSSTQASPSFIIGYGTVRGDNPTPFGTSSTAPSINTGANAWTAGQYQHFEYLNITGTASSMFTAGTSAQIFMCKFTNTSTIALRSAFVCGTGGVVINCEFVAQFGIGASFTATDSQAYGCFFHDSSRGVYMNATRSRVFDCVFISHRSSAINVAQSIGMITGCTIFNYSTPRGNGILSAAAQIIAYNNIISGCATGINTTTTQQYSTLCNNNIFYNNTSDRALTTSGSSDVTGTNPSFTDITQLSGSTATTSGSVLTQSGGDFSSVVDNRDYIHILSGTGITAGVYLITSHTSTTVTLNIAPGTNATADKVWTITTGRDVSVGTAMKALGTPGAFPGSDTTGYKDPGAAQRQEPTSSGSGGSYTFLG